MLYVNRRRGDGNTDYLWYDRSSSENPWLCLMKEMKKSDWYLSENDSSNGRQKASALRSFRRSWHLQRPLSMAEISHSCGRERGTINREETAEDSAIPNMTVEKRKKKKKNGRILICMTNENPWITSRCWVIWEMFSSYLIGASTSAWRTDKLGDLQKQGLV